jgi:hypothetical protein
MSHSGVKTSQFRGVSFNKHTGRYEVRLKFRGRKYYLGLFDDDISAAIVYDAWCEKLGCERFSNRANERYATETAPVFAGESRICRVCSGRAVIRAAHYKDGEWVDAGEQPCPACSQEP